MSASGASAITWMLAAMLAATVLIAAAGLRGFEYDEAYSLFLTAAVPRPVWPAGPFRAGDMGELYHAASGPVAIAAALRADDVHPPLYFWVLSLWRQALGDSLFVARLLSVGCALGALGAVAAIARRARVPALGAVLLTLGCYGFTYTGAVARGFALAQLLVLAGAALALRAQARRHPAEAAGAGLLLGAATAANYLASFVAAAVLLWLLLRRAPRVLVPAVAGFAAFLPLDLWFFLAQRGSRDGQFPPFTWGESLVRLARCFGGAVAGGLPLYLPPPAGAVAAVVLAGSLAGLAVLVVRRWPVTGRRGSRQLLGLAAVAPAAGLLALGAVFDTTPIEIRYLAFATPFCALLLAGALRGTDWRRRRLIVPVVAAVQTLALAGLLFRPETMQPARAAAAAAAALAGTHGLVLLPLGNDGVGVVGPFVAEAPPGLRVLVVRPGMPEASVRRAAAAADPAVLVLAAPDAESRAAVLQLRTLFTAGCWQPTGTGFDTAAFRWRCPRMPP